MSFAIQIGNEYLDLIPDSVLELESDNPFLQFNEQVTGNYSLPFEVLATPKNMRLLNYAGILQQRITNAGIDARVYHNGIQHSRGKIKLEQPNININRPGSGRISCYYLSGSSDFYQDVKNKLLREIDMGGDRSFANFDALYDHIQEVMRGDVGEFDYAIFPVINKDWVHPSGDNPDIMNRVFKNDDDLPMFLVPWDGDPLPGVPCNRIVPFPYLKQAIIQAAAYAGWSIEGDILNDGDFEKIVLINFRAIDYAPYPHRAGGGSKSPIVFNLSDHLPDITISEFFIALKNRFGWWYDFNFVSKKILIRHLRDLVSVSQKDLTRYASPLIPKKIRQDDRVYALRNTFISGRGEPIRIDAIDYQGYVSKVSDLPTASESLAEQVYLVVEENNYYWCIDDSGWKWQILSSNNADYEPPGHNEDIITSATTMDMEKYNDYLDLVPRLDLPGIWGASDIETPWYLHLAFFFGQRNNKAGYPVPFASQHIYDSNGVQLADWSLSFKGKKTDGTEVGLYDLNWQPFLELFDNMEQFEARLYLPFHEYLNLKFSDTIVISNTKMFISKINSVVPYRNEIKVEAIRIL